jgi:hypothetical protein
MPIQSEQATVRQNSCEQSEQIRQSRDIFARLPFAPPFFADETKQQKGQDEQKWQKSEGIQ